ncbi:reverse transcriptase domain-containing protein [Tanacetum coccineum]
MEEISHVLWAYRTMVKSSNGDTPFSLTYGTEAVIPTEIGMPTFRTAELDMAKNDEALKINLELLEEKREQAAIKEAKSKRQMEKILQCQRPKWEGPYQVIEALGKGSYRLKDRHGKELPRTWNACNLKKCYIHKIAVMGRIYSRDPDIFLTQSKSQSQSEGPKEESNSSPHSLGNLKFVPKGETVEVFGMEIPDPLITEAIQQSSYYPKYLEMVAENTKKTPQESASVQPATKHAPPKKPTTTTPVKQSKLAPAPTKKPSKHKLQQKIRKGKPTFQLIDEDNEAQQESIPQEEGDD